MAKRDTARDIRELPIYAIQHCGETTLEVIEGYAKKRRVTSHRIGSAFWSLVDEGQIRVEKGSDGMYYVVEGGLAMTMTEYEILKKRIEEWNRGKGAEFQLQLDEAKEDYVDPDYGVFKKYGAWGMDWSGPFIMFDNIQELEEELEMLQWSYQQEQSDWQERRL